MQTTLLHSDAVSNPIASRTAEHNVNPENPQEGHARTGVRRTSAFCLLATSLVLGFASLRAWASEGLDVPEALAHKVPLEGLGGLHLVLSKMYNENLWLYALVCTVLMAAVGMVFALVTDLALKSIGLETSKIEHRE